MAKKKDKQMINERVSRIKVSDIDPNIVRLFLLVGPNEIAPMPGIVIYKIGDNLYSATRTLEGGGKVVIVLEIIDGMLKPAMN